MKDQDLRRNVRAIANLMLVIGVMVLFVFGMLIYYAVDPALTAFKQTTTEQVVEVDPNLVENGVHVRTGLVEGKGLMAVVNNCTNCHSAKLVIQNRMNAEQWKSTIRWMQRTQNLWDLGSQEDIIINYLVENYPTRKKGRRENLADTDWYVLEE